MSNVDASGFGFRVPRGSVSFSAMYKSGLFADEPLFDIHGNHTADVVGGRVVMRRSSVSLSSFTAAARLNEVSVPYSFSVVRNGFKYWHVLRSGVMVSIFDVKETACRQLEEHVKISLELLSVSSNTPNGGGST